MEELGVDLLLGPNQAQAPRRTVRHPLPEQHPSRPRTPAESALLAASEALVFRALERAGNRLRAMVGKPPGVPSYETHLFVKANGASGRLLDDAWGCAPQVLTGIADPTKVVPLLDSYCTALLTEQAPHTRDRLRDWLNLMEVSP
jgi:hypothetical protein